MEKYFAELQASPIPLPKWGVIVLWVVIFCFANVLARKSRAHLGEQQFIINENTAGLIRKESLKLTLIRIALSGAIFAYASFFGGPIFSFTAGGWVVLAAVSISLQMRSYFFLRALSRPDAAKGSVTLSARLVIKQQAFHLFGLAALCLLLGILLAHLALFGGALFISATAYGYLRKTRVKPNAPGDLG
jgi:hypothetical protein